MPKVFVSIGSNIDPADNVRSAVAALRHRFGHLELSSVYESEPVGFDGARFYNLVAAFETNLSLVDINRRLRQIEDAHGRVRGGDKFDSRTLDLDVLLFGSLVDHVRGIPRHEIDEYAFVLKPLAEIAGDVNHPKTGHSFKTMWERFPAASQRLWRVEAGLGKDRGVG
ncbi:MAG: 2-amino-4-hydroxy-6-hydroxymethyldihydropteridine diphosphokinase [Gammaproteobacteria bacterium]|nr:2-amino-4-hydroxy-6-hydroxymethyldihydropteridine diphosphokinase [Gammaproteobacteria bacterium]